MAKAKAAARPTKKVLPPEIEKIGMTTSRSLEKHTKKSWSDWISRLDQAGARNWTHQEIVAYLKTRCRLSPWWQQIVTSGFEVHTGKRLEGQSVKGTYSVTVTKSLPVTGKELWSYMVSDAGLAAWLQPLSPIDIKPKQAFEVEGEVYGEIRTLSRGKRIRLSWREAEWTKPTYLTVHVLSRPAGSSLLVFNHDDLVNTRLREQMRSHWRAAAGRVEEWAKAKTRN